MTEATGIVGEFFSLKEDTDADLLTMQCGDFYEFFGEDAELVSEELDLKVSQKSSHGSSYPMAGVPIDDLTPYLKALVERGYRVAVADQYETDSGHAREVVRVVTPGTLLETSDADAQYMAAVVDGSEVGGASSDGYGLAFADVTTGRFLVADAADPDEALTELYRFDPVEVLPGPEVRTDDDLLGKLRERVDATLTLHETDAFAPKRGAHTVREQFGTETVDRLSVGEQTLAAAGAVLSYVEETGAGVLASMTRIQAHHGDDHVTLDATTQRNLELTETMQGDGDGSLFATIDHTETSAGGRLLKEWLQRPRRSLETLEERQASVDALSTAALARDEIQDRLGEAYDLARLASKASHGSADARDLVAVRETLAVLPAVAETIESTPALADSPLSAIVDRPDRAAARELRETLEEAVAEDPPSTVTQGELLRKGYDDELDEVIERHEEVREWLDTLAEREKRQHGLSHVTVDRNKTDGYYIQVGKSAADGVPDHYEQIKTLKNSKRFTTEELEEKERDVLRLEDRRGELEYELFEELRDEVAERAALLQDVGRALATIDALASLATHAAENRWVRPELHRGDDLTIEQGRHPVVEQTTEFVPNDVRMDEDRGFLVVTGPNMSGKSTYMRQVACIVLLAQIGSFVPAEAAEIGVVDGIFTRVGALDELAQGRSTFMVEMSELSNILHTATEESLVILDEVGRGTATYDGISIAWAATEYLHNEVKAKTLFATHYHELTGLAENLPRVANVHVAADERDGEVTFLRTVRDGPTDRSYGVHVADLAGVPDPVVDRSREVLERLREEKAIEAKGGASNEPVQAVFDLGSGTMQTESQDRSQAASTDGGPAGESAAAIDPETEAVLEDLESIDVNTTPPIELVSQVQELQERLEE
ncbi:DNA mismatch repair protein MutS [Natrinema pellirubrum DSM 15624]|uniref:DNA mismatch repair protein MutS n=1 Tax=Natrinema pellirubrum (strain DSM 15624 / CIP 106293 / JCM 10476 / NCIMB 786 / 157) TaxID=797303 RepID=L0JJT7_NATP1|nr:DNA mismatch repair protein MutS [Natrinema pellirubrum]AGB30626.1 DNA mismatch repair protein MutS [Natrinema pellirubrum DSM 15624]ELY74899.1 DNA mismatch repair protein MutS [Natrinema pellirubrum DSM 15624]